MSDLEHLGPKVIGARLADARKARGITQEEAAAHLGCSRPTLIAIEKGTRPPKSPEILSLAKLYGLKVSDVVRPGEPLGDLRPHLRAVARQMKADGSELAEPIAFLQRFAENYQRLERILQLPLPTNYPEPITLRRGDPTSLAEDTADQERRRLGLGDQPVIHLRSLLEAEVGLRIAYAALPSRIAGMFAFSADLGGVILVNRKHPPERRRATMLHEYGHLLTDRFKPGIDYLSHPGRKPASERFADAFAMAFLMPSASVRRRFNQVVNESGDFQIADLCRLSHFFFVSVEAMSLRLEGLGLIPMGTRDYLKDSRFEVGRASRLLGLGQHPVADNPFPDRYLFLAVQAFDRGELSESELVRILGCDRVAARDLVERFLTTAHVSEDGNVHDIRLEPQRSLLGSGPAARSEP